MKKATVFMSAALLVAPAFMGFGMTTPQAAGGEMPGHVMAGRMWRSRGRSQHRYFLRFLAGRLNLTDQQKTDIRGIIQSERASTKDLRAKFEENRQQLMMLNGDDSQVQTLAADQGQLIVSAEHTKAEIYKVLTPEQQQQLQNMRKAWQQRMQERKSQEGKPAAQGAEGK
jgi:Spy/CpxP family protein refolding chaperone